MAVDIEDLLDAISYQESRHNPKAFNPKSGAAGQYQFMPATARQYGLNNPYDPVAARNAARQMVMDLARQHNGDIPKILASYNWGTGNVAHKGMHRMPAETRDYVVNITSRLGGAGGGESEGAGGQGEPIPEPVEQPVDEIAQWRAERAAKAQQTSVEQPAPVTITDPAPVDEIAQWRAERAAKAQQAPVEQPKPKDPYWGDERSAIYLPGIELDKNATGTGSFWERLAAKQVQGLSDFGAGAAGTARQIGNLVKPGSGDAQLDPSNVNEGSFANTMGSLADPITTAAGTKIFNTISKLPAIAPIVKNAAGEVITGKIRPLYNAMLSGAGTGAGVAVPTALTEANQGNYKQAMLDELGSAAMGGVLPGIGTGAGKVLEAGVNNIGYPAKNMASRLLREGMGENLDPAIQQLIQYSHSVNPRGFAPKMTAGRAATPFYMGGSKGSGKEIPELKVIEESARLGPLAGEYLNADLANKNAKVNYLRRIGENAEKVDINGQYHPLSFSEGYREGQTRPFYNRADKQEIYVNPELEQILKGVEVKPAVNQGERGYSQLINNAETVGRVPPAATISGGTVTPPINPMGSLAQNPPPAYGEHSVLPYRTIENLSLLRKKLYDRANAMKLSNGDEARRLKDAAAQLTTHMEKASPDYADAQKLFKQYSIPENQGRLALALKKGIVTESGKYTPKTYLDTSANYEKLLKDAELNNLFRHPNEVLTTKQQDELNILRRRVSDDVRYNDLKTTGMSVGAVPLAQQIEKEVPSTLNRKMVIAKRALGALGGFQKKAVQNEIDKAWLSPKTAVELLKQQPLLEREKVIMRLRHNDFNKTLLSNMVNNAVD